jgi:hypothetical protein
MERYFKGAFLWKRNAIVSNRKLTLSEKKGFGKEREDQYG